MRAWLQYLDLPLKLGSLTPLQNEASFRQYFRITAQDSQTYIVMDSPPDKENNARFVQTASYFYSQGINVPQLIAQDSQQGFFLLSDLGSTTYLEQLHTHKQVPQTLSPLYHLGLDTLLAIQRCSHPTVPRLANYNTALLMEELGLFKQWFLEKHLGHHLNDDDNKQWHILNEQLVQSALKQPQVCVHRDYHSRNLMYLSPSELGVLDFQDAVWGPITYDVVSLLRDCYIQWPEAFINEQLLFFYENAKNHFPVLETVDFKTFKRWFDWMGVQRHLKVLGIFARLHWRDNKPTYLQHNISRIYRYLIDVSAGYQELHWLQAFLVKQQPYANIEPPL